MSKLRSRREFLSYVAMAGAATSLAACAPPAPAPVVSGNTPAPPPKAVVDLRWWNPFGGVRGEKIQELIVKYNSTQGVQDNIKVTVEIVPTSDMPQKLTAVRMAGTEPEVYELSMPVKLLAQNGVVAPLPPEEATFVKETYIEAAVNEMTYSDQVWGYPMGTQAAAYYYRRSFFEKAGIKSPPKDTDEMARIARELTQTIDGKKYYGYVREYDNNWLSVDWEELVWKFGGEPYEFDGDRPMKVFVDTPELRAALQWLLGMIDDGSTQIFDMSARDAFDNALAISGRTEVSWPIRLRDEMKDTSTFEDLMFVGEPAAPGIKSRVRANGWALFSSRTIKYPEEGLKFLGWMAHKPEMQYSHVRIDFTGSIPNVIDYPLPIATWTEGMNSGFGIETPKIMTMRPGRKVKGGDEIKETIAATMQAILNKKVAMDPALVALQPVVDKILARSDPF